MSRSPDGARYIARGHHLKTYLCLETFFEHLHDGTKIYKPRATDVYEQCLPPYGKAHPQRLYAPLVFIGPFHKHGTGAFGRLFVACQFLKFSLLG